MAKNKIVLNYEKITLMYRKLKRVPSTFSNRPRMRAGNLSESTAPISIGNQTKSLSQMIACYLIRSITQKKVIFFRMKTKILRT